MDFLSQGYARLVDLFKSMTPGARITAGLLLTLVVISLAYLVNHASSGQRAYLNGGEPFSAAKLPAMEAAFAKAGLNDYQIDGNRVRVPQGKQAAYMGALADGGAIPLDIGTQMEKSVSGSPWESKQARQERMRIYKQIQLQSIICNMQGIENASVMYDAEESKSIFKEKAATASVNVKPLGSNQLDENQVRMIRNLVSRRFRRAQAAVRHRDRSEQQDVSRLGCRRRRGGRRRRSLHRPQADVRKAVGPADRQCAAQHSRRHGGLERRARSRDAARRIVD